MEINLPPTPPPPVPEPPVETPPVDAPIESFNVSRENLPSR